MNLTPNRTRLRDKSIHLDIINLVDVVFLLLIFFMVTSSLHKINKLDVNLPKSQYASQNLAHQTIDILIDSHGIISVNHQRIQPESRESLKKVMNETLQLSKNTYDASSSYSPLIRVLGDAQSPHQSFVTVMDVLTELQITRIQLGTMPDDKQN